MTKKHGKPRRDDRRDDRRRHKPGATRKDARANDSPRKSAAEAAPGALWLYGRHAVAAAMANPARNIRRVLVSTSAFDWLADVRAPKARLALAAEIAMRELDALLPEGAVHQGVAAEVEELARARLKEVCRPEAGRPVLVLDQITDPHNIGAIFRSAAAFGACAVIAQERRTPPLAGALAKAAAGAVETVPFAPVVNVARALEALKGLGFHVAGLAGEADAVIAEAPRDRPIALVLGAEGAGLRRLVRQTCDRLYRIPIAPGMESLNVSNAAAVALYELSGRGGTDG